MPEEQLPAGFRIPSVPSSNIKAIAWLDQDNEDMLQYPEAEVGRLAIIFTNGTRYEYNAVPREIITSLLEAESIGKAFNQLVKNAKDEETDELIYKSTKVESKDNGA